MTISTITFRPIDQWPDGWRDHNANRHRYTPSPFRASYSDTVTMLVRECNALSARAAWLQVDASDRDVRRDGQLRADARVRHPGVILTIDSAKHGTLVYRCATYRASTYGTGSQHDWHHNLRAIALGLEALRQVDRYGITDQGQQYAGFAALPPATPMGGGASLSITEAAQYIARNTDDPDGRLADVAEDPWFALALYRDAAHNLHPDHGGTAQGFNRLQECRALLTRTRPT